MPPWPNVAVIRNFPPIRSPVCGTPGGFVEEEFNGGLAKASATRPLDTKYDRETSALQAWGLGGPEGLADGKQR